MSVLGFSQHRLTEYARQSPHMETCSGARIVAQIRVAFYCRLSTPVVDRLISWYQTSVSGLGVIGGNCGSLAIASRYALVITSRARS